VGSRRVQRYKEQEIPTHALKFANSKNIFVEELLDQNI
jgi:hypothetical protein